MNRKLVTLISIMAVLSAIFSCKKNNNIEPYPKPSTEHSIEERKEAGEQMLFQYLFYEGDMIKAKSVYLEVDKKVIHKLFTMERGEFIEIPNFTLSSTFELYNNFNSLIQTELEKNQNIKITEIVYEVNTELSISYFERLKELNSQNQNDIYLKLIAQGYYKIPWGGPSDNNCGGWCDEKENYVCVSPDPWDPGERAYCKKFTPVCRTDDNKKHIDDAGMGSSIEIFRSFRDQFLVQTNFGTKYAQYYYALGGHLVNKIPLDLILETIAYFPLIIEKTTLLSDHGNRGHEIVLSDTETNSILILLDKYKSLSLNTDYISIVDNMVDDLNKINGMTKTDFLNNIR